MKSFWRLKDFEGIKTEENTGTAPMKNFAKVITKRIERPQ